MICKLCLANKDLISAHIIPASFYREAIPNNAAVIIGSDEYTKRSPIGIYDKKILCENCEKNFTDWDHYGYKFFHEMLKSPQRTIRTDKASIDIFENVNYSILKLFLISVLWRASVTDNDFFENVSLGPFNEIIRKKIINLDPGLNQEFATTIFKLDTKTPSILYPPSKIRLKNRINGYKFYFFNTVIFIKVDKQPLNEYRPLILSPDAPLCVSLTPPPEISRRIDQASGR